MEDKKMYRWAAALGVAAAIVVTPFALAAADTSAPPTKGRVPEAAFQDNGKLDKSKVPDFIPALDRAGNQVGYVSRDLAMPDASKAGSEAPIPVYADDLTTVVGSMVPGRGFVHLGARTSDVPSFEARTSESP